MTIHWGILGCGDIAHKRVADAIVSQSDSVLLAACRRDEAKLRDFCEKYQVERAYQDDSQLLNDADIDVVYVATPVHLHLPQTLAAAMAKKHVLVEKPMACSTDECTKMIEACKENGVQLGVAYYRRFYPMVLRMKEILKSGEIGQPLSISAVTATPFALQPGEDGYWRVIKKEGGGGSLMDIGSHRLNLFVDMFGEVETVKAVCGTMAGDYEAEDCASLVLRFKSGVHGSLQCFFRSDVDPDEFSIIGTKGRMTARPLNGSKLYIDLANGSRIEEHPAPANLHAPLIDDFANAVIQQRTHTVTGEEGLLVNDIMERAYADAGV